jgi:hypothetical protein
MTLLDYLKSNWEGFPIYFNTIKFDDYFINIVPFMLGNKVVKYDDEKIYDNKGDLFITDNTLLVEKAKKENFSILLIGEIFKEGVEVSENIRLISTLKTEDYEEELDIFEAFNLSLKISGFEKAKIFNLDNFIGEEKKFIPTQPPPPPPALRKEVAKFIPTQPPPPPPALSKEVAKFIPTQPPPPPPALSKEVAKFIPTQPPPPALSKEVAKFIPTQPPPPPPALSKEVAKFIPTQPPPPPPALRKEQVQKKEEPKSRFQFVPFVKEQEFKHSNMINMINNEYDYFPKRKEEYMYTDVSLYSSADVSHSLKTAELISKYYDISNKTLTEASACIGGNSWSFADKVKNINLVEIDANNFKALKHNMEVMFNNGSFNTGKNISFFNDNYIKIRDEIGGDIIFYDPPWGGVDYKNEPQVGYSYGGKFYTIEDMAKKSFYKVPPELIVFRVPTSSNVLNSDYKYETTVDFNDLYGKAIYKLIFLSDIKGGDLPSDIKVKRINYKKIEYDVIL